MRFPILLAAALGAAACTADAPIAPEDASLVAVHAAAHGRAGATPADLNQQLAALRRATARFHNFAAAQSAGHTELFMNMCMEHPTLGAMGYHWVDMDLMDATAEVSAPEALLYERGPSGEYRLTGVEYVVPADAWSGSAPPRLFGQEFSLNAFNLWTLHVWIWKDNPSGLFAPWNPDVSCP